MITRIVLVLILAKSFFPHAHAGTVPYAGVWAGTIGSQKVRVCFTANDAHYYYSKHMKGIRLLAEDPSEDGVAPIFEWKETLPPINGSRGTSGLWQLENLADGSLSGNWSDPQNGKRLKIKLEKLEDLQDQSCGKAFYHPIENSASEITKKWDVFLLPSSYAGAARFNAYVHSRLRESTLESYVCQMDYSNEVEMELTSEVLTSKVLVIRETIFEHYCGGAHNTGGTTYQVYDPQTGRKIESWMWIKGGAELVREYRERTYLRRLIEKLNPAVDGERCRKGFDVSSPYPTKKGFMFRTNFGWAGRVCDSTVLIPYDKLRPYLTVEGKAVAKSFAEN